jgi:hypothetical protein
MEIVFRISDNVKKPKIRISDNVKKPKIHINPVNRAFDENQEQTGTP